MILYSGKFFLLLMGLLFSLVSIAAEPSQDYVTKRNPKQATELTLEQLKSQLARQLPNIAIQSITMDEDLGMFRVLTNDLEEIFVSLNGEYLVTGEKYRIEKRGKLTNLSKLERTKRQLVVIKQMPMEKLIVFPAQGERKAWVTVFTDIDCGYCRTFHRGMEEVTKLGIEVRYAAFPRSGIGTDSYHKAVNVWCAKNQQQAMTDAKMGKSVQSDKCVNPVQEHHTIGLRAGVRGTPTMFTSNDKVIPGYVPAARLAQMLGI